MPKVTIPEELICPITGKLMKDPVTVIGENRTYEREAIERRFAEHYEKYGVKLAEQRRLVPNDAMRKQIAALNLCTKEELYTCLRKGSVKKLEALNYTFEMMYTDDTLIFRGLITPWCSVEILEYLLNAGLNVQIRDKYRRNMLHYACNGEQVNALLTYGANIEAKDGDGETALHRMGYGCHFKEKVLLSLLKQGANLSAKNNAGETPLHICAREGLPKALECLLEHGADVNMVNNQGKKPVDLINPEENSCARELKKIFREWPIKKLQATCVALSEENKMLRADMADLKKQMVEVLKLVQAPKIAKDKPSTSASTPKRGFF